MNYDHDSAILVPLHRRYCCRAESEIPSISGVLVTRRCEGDESGSLRVDQIRFATESILIRRKGIVSGSKWESSEDPIRRRR